MSSWYLNTIQTHFVDESDRAHMGTMLVARLTIDRRSCVICTEYEMDPSLPAELNRGEAGQAEFD